MDRTGTMYFTYKLCTYTHLIDIRFLKKKNIFLTYDLIRYTKHS